MTRHTITRGNVIEGGPVDFADVEQAGPDLLETEEQQTAEPLPLQLSEPKYSFLLGNLRDTYKQVVPGTMSTADTLMITRRLNRLLQPGIDLCIETFYPAEGILYFMDGTTPKLAITSEENNLVLRHIDDAFGQICRTGHYFPTVLEAQQAIAADSTFVFDVTKLMQGIFLPNHIEQISINTLHYDKLNAEQRRLAECLYGQGNDFVHNMTMAAEQGIETIPIYLYTPKYLKKILQGSSYMAKVAFLGSHARYYCFSTCGSDAVEPRFIWAMRTEDDPQPVLSSTPVPPPSPPPKNFADYLDEMLDNPQETLRHLDDDRARELLQLLADHYNR